MYRGFYINLDRAQQRREALETHLRQAGLSDRYRRFAAIDGKTITYGPERVSGTAVLGCLLSHLSVLKENADGDAHLHIIEDDAVLHPELPRGFEAFVSHERLERWDLLMTDVFLPPDLYLFKFLRQKLAETSASGSISFLDIAGWDFAGANSYFVNKGSIKKVMELVEHGFGVETPYDIRIKQLVTQGLLKAYVCFPFLSTLSDLCTDSNIAGFYGNVNPLFEYRRSFYIGADLAAINDRLRPKEASPPDLHEEIYLNLVKTLLAPEYTPF